MIPPTTSGTRDAFVEQSHKACKQLGLPKKGDNGYKQLCTKGRNFRSSNDRE